MIGWCGIGVRPQSQKPFVIREKKVAVREMLSRPMPVAVRENCLPEMAHVSPVSSLGEESA